MSGFPVGIKISVIKSSRLYRVVFAHSQNTDASLGPVTRLVKGVFWTATPCIVGCRSAVYHLYTTRFYDRLRKVRIPRGIEVLMGATY